MELGFILLIFGILLLRNRIKAALIQRQREELVRELLHRVEQKKRLDELYGRR